MISTSLPFLLAILVTSSTFQPKVSPETVFLARGHGRIPVVVMLHEPDVTMSSLDVRKTAIATSQSRVLNVLAGSGFELRSRWRTIPGFAGEISERGLAILASHPEVRRVDPDVGGGGNLADSKPFIGADLVTAAGYTGKGVTVAILDSGVAAGHPAISSRVVDEACFCRNSDSTGCCPNGETSQTGDGAATDDHGHGSNVTGIVASEGGGGASVGMAPDVAIVAVKVLDKFNSFNSSSQVIDGMDYIIDNAPEVRVVNMSLGTSARFTGFCDNAASFTMAFSSAVNTLRSRGTLVFVSAGNSADSSDIEAPACVENSIAVGAVYNGNIGFRSYSACSDSTSAPDQITCFSNGGTALDLLAPGAQVTSSGRNSSGTTTFYGTSQASPHAAGLAATMLDADPTLTPSQIESVMKSTGVLITDSRNGLTFPRIDASAAIHAVAPTVTPKRRRAVRRPK